MPLSGLGDLPVYEGHEPGSHKQVAVVPIQIGSGHILEEGGGIGPNNGIGCHQREVGIELCGLLIIVARANLGDLLDVPPLLSGNEADLGVDLDALKAVEEGTSGLFQPLSPLYVILLVEPCPQLHEHSDILAILGSGGQVLNKLGFGSQTVNGNFNR